MLAGEFPGWKKDARHYAHELGRNLDDFIVGPGLGARSGLLGALALGKYELDRHGKQGADSSAA